MISIIICSINPERCKKTIDNLSETIGLECEVIVFDNRQYNWGICKVYNHCAEKAKYPYLCFVHEDVFIDTKEWGKKITEFVERTPKCGVVGFAGGCQIQKNISSWWAGETRMNIRDGYKGGNKEYLRRDYLNHRYDANPEGEYFSKVVCIDGLFQFVKKRIWEEIRYDEKTFKGFHFYDVDFSYAVSRRYHNYVILWNEVYHDSPGRTDNKEYIEGMFIFQEKWNKDLPKSIRSRGRINNLLAELNGAYRVLGYCKRARVGIKEYSKQILKINGIGYFIIITMYLCVKIPLKIIIKTLTKIRRKK
ncbi:MAG: glycosyltransferase family protein [Dysgonamonadaceae bacterium]|jgi:hypothetical protein|nr:glycosyltransferase family protein [Dysgonamonadaceae bacterium]